jgi:hypothetical protein
MTMDPFHAGLLQRAAACMSTILRDAPAELELLMEDFSSANEAADAFFLFADACVTATGAMATREADEIIDGLAAPLAEVDLLRLGADMVRAQTHDDREERAEAAAAFADSGEALRAGMTIAIAAVQALADATGRSPTDWASTFAVNAARLGDE